MWLFVYERSAILLRIRNILWVTVRKPTHPQSAHLWLQTDSVKYCLCYCTKKWQLLMIYLHIMWHALIIKIMFHTLQLFAYIFTVYIVLPYTFTCDVTREACMAKWKSLSIQKMWIVLFVIVNSYLEVQCHPGWRYIILLALPVKLMKKFM